MRGCGASAHAKKSCIVALDTQVEDVLQLSEELALAELPDDFQATALRELEQEACTQLAELLQNVLRLDEITLAAAEAVANGPSGGGVSGSCGDAGRGAHPAVLALDQRLEDASALLGLLDTFAHWCEKTMATTLPSPAPPPPIIAAAAAPSEPDPEAAEATEAAGMAEAAEATSACPRAPEATLLSTPPRPPSGAAAQSIRLVRPVARSEARQRLEAYVQGVASVYLHAEGTWLHGAVGVAVSSDEVADETAPDGPVLSLVDDVFYVLLKSFQRAMRSGHATHVMVPLLSQIVDAARQRCVPALHDRMREAGAADAGNSAFIAAVNSLEYAAHNADRLRQVVQDAFFSRLADSEAEADGAADGAAEGLAALATLSSDLSGRAAEATAQLADALMPTAWLLLDFGPADFVLDEVKEVEQQRSFELKLLQPLAATLRALQQRLRRANMNAVTRHLALVLSERFEQAVMQKRFNELGAMLLSELVQQLSDTLSEPSGSVRQELGRLRQLVFMLNVGSLSEATGLGLSGVGSSLSREELCDILARRIEFDENDVRDVLLA
jgi:hypothetical protein